MKYLLTRGSISVVQMISWCLGIVVPVTLASSAFTNNQIDKLSQDNTAVVQRISVVETKSEVFTQDIKELKAAQQTTNDRLGQLLYANGIIPKK